VSTLKVDTLQSRAGGAVTFTTTPIGAGNIIESIGGLCDGSTRTTNSGTTFTLPNITSGQDILGTTYTTITSSNISYKAPSNAIGVRVEWKHRAAWAGDTAHGIQHYKMFINEGSSDVEITAARCNQAADYIEGQVDLCWYFRIDSSLSSLDTTTGAVPSWNSSKTMFWQCRAYGTNDVGRMHGSQYWDGGGSNQFHKPQVWITAYGASN